MPKTGNTLTKPMYTFLTPRNRRWVLSQTKRSGARGYSAWMDTLITRVRKRHERDAQVSTRRKAA